MNFEEEWKEYIKLKDKADKFNKLSKKISIVVSTRIKRKLYENKRNKK
jgi:hypothetical protein